MPVDRFPASYADARARFVAAVRAQGSEAIAYKNDRRGPAGEELATDVAWFGPRDAPRVLVIVSGTHGVEGACGSAAQLDWCLDSGPQRLLPETAACLVHAINPHGFAWLRRVTEEGVDLNRNFVDFAAPLPENPEYDALADAIVPRSLDGSSLEAAERRIAAFRAEHGEAAFRRARTRGQYRHPTGMFFGGQAPTWARRTLEAIVRDFRLADRRIVAVIDVHSGLGPYGYGEPIGKNPPGTEGAALARRWYGPSLTQPAAGTSTTTLVSGGASDGWFRAAGDRVIYVAPEFGTLGPESGRIALRADHWLHAWGRVDWADDETRTIKAAIKTHYDPVDPGWREMVLFRMRQIIGQALVGLAQA
ncbi:MAG: M14 family metallopeptidase [Alphaproteobacteria bacterium]|nr:M14 family metallopeptidase [Alphaproteobacteria bacterium]